MVLSGAYAMWYARWELSVYSGNLGSDVVIDTGERWRLNVITFIEDVGAVRLGAVVLAAVAVTIGIAQLVADRRTSTATGDDR